MGFLTNWERAITPGSHQFLQTIAGLEESRLDCAFRQRKDAGDIGDFHIIDKAQDDDLALFGRQLPDCLQQMRVCALVLTMIGRIAYRLRDARLEREEIQEAPFVTEVLQINIAHYGKQPGVDAGVSSKILQCRQCPAKCLLHDVLGISGLAAHQVSRSHETVAIARNQVRQR
jgi:hypothetical protein